MMSKYFSPEERRPRKFGQKIYIASFSFYVGTGPVYWIPWVDLKIVYGIKVFLFIIISIYPILAVLASKKGGQLSFPGGNISILLFFLFIIFSIPAGILGIQNGNVETVIRRELNIFQVMIFLYSCGYAIRGQFIQEITRKAILIISSVCMISFIGIIFIPNYSNPLNQELSLFQTGFGGSRTGWAPSIALYFPWLYVLKLLPSTITLLVMFSLLGNQISVAGRAGLLASFIPFGLWGWLSRRWRVFIASLVGMAIAIIYAVINAESLRLSGATISSVDGLDEFSSGRWDQYGVAIRAIMSDPLTGHGIGALYYDGAYWTIHNIILRFAVEGGIIYAMLAVAIISVPAARGFRKIRNKDRSNVNLAAVLTIISGLVNAMFEPEGMFGTFNQVCFWWVCYAICVSGSSRKIDLLRVHER